MATTATLLAVDLPGGESLESARGEPRRDALRIADYSPFPRVSPDQLPRVGVTHDPSAFRLCLGVSKAEPVGSLLRVTVRDVDGRPARTSIQRVVSCSATPSGRYWLGLDLITEAGRQLEQRTAAGAALRLASHRVPCNRGALAGARGAGSPGPPQAKPPGGTPAHR